MSIRIKAKALAKNTINPDRKGFHAIAKKRGDVGLEELCKMISYKSSFSPGDVKGIVETLIEEIETNIARGYHVHIDGLGIFSPALRSRVVATEREVRGSIVTCKGLNYRVSPRLKESLRRIEFRLPKPGREEL